MRSRSIESNVDGHPVSGESRLVDMHVHTTHSDGTRTPAETVEAASKCGLAAVVVTDHDEVSGVPEALDAGADLGVEVISGIEITTEDGQGQMHILGYGIDPDNGEMRTVLDKLRNGRFNRARQIVDRLADMGISIDFDELVDAAGPGIIGRPHIARKIYEQGAVGSLQEAFVRYIGRGKPAYVNRWRISPQDTVRMLHTAGGLAVLAHPKLDCAERTIPELVQAGLDGLEVYHTKHKRKDVKRYKALADRYGLLKTGGSDCHGPAHGQKALMGSVRVPYDYFERIKRKLALR